MTEVNIGNWSGLNTREMAIEADCERLYKFSYTPFSGVAHNMWQHVSGYNLEQCKNPLHKYHMVPTIAEVPLDPDYVYRSAKYVDRSYEVFDVKFNLDIDTEMPHDWYVKEFEKLLSDDSNSYVRDPATTESATYHGNVKSKVFHKLGCRYYDCKDCTAAFETREAAIQAEYRACKACNP